ncbi:MATE family efflux transporter [Williamwhitmania taraxaci]|uniref:Multidrug-efflux transporter n=1 Tax=Williamwhitmania taraxaci TaxID=1640674 RepID=A0A1G6LIV9_9BACT|nr:MATE family efflux transporter [Williamwhitmania taraxaci]SDC43218.1 putative efflux protein, MATE family [Williamwhitmania taraxaci]
MKDLTTGNEGKLILGFAAPMLIGNIFQQAYNIVDAIIVGKFLGKEALAAVGASFPIIYAVIALVIGIGSGASIVISQYFGAKDYASVKKASDTINIFLMVTGIIVGLVGFFFSRNLLQLIQLPPELIPQAQTYLSIYLGGMVVFFGFNGAASILRGLGDSKTPLYFLAIATIFNIVFDLLFVVVFKWGIAGAAIATLFAQGGAFATAIFYLNKNHNLLNYSFTRMHFSGYIFKQILRIGLPSGIQQSFIAAGIVALNTIVNTFGTNVIAAYSAAGRIDSLAALPAMNFSAALSGFVGQNMGAGKLDRIKKGLTSTLLMSSVVCVILTALIIVFSTQLMQLFTTDEAVIAIGREYLIIVSTFYILFSTMFVFHGVLRGAGASIAPMIISIFALWLFRIPAAMFLSNIFGEKGIWWAIPIGWGIGLVGSIIYYRTGRWKKKGVIGTKDSTIQSDNTL